jgi:hypothetical protein
MVKVNDERVVGLRNYFRLLELEPVREIGFGFDFYEIPYSDEAFANAPRMFAFSMKSPSAGHLIGVSTEVPEEFRRFWAVHEFLEEDKPEYKERCLDTLKQERGLVPRADESRYIRVRAEFFRGLVEYARANGYTPEQIEQFTLSRDYLNGLERSL